MFASVIWQSYIRRPLHWRWEWFVADIFEEIDEELKEENFKKLWDRYGSFLIAAVILLVGGVAAYKFWESYTCLLYTSPSPRDRSVSRMPSSA